MLETIRQVAIAIEKIRCCGFLWLPWRHSLLPQTCSNASHFKNSDTWESWQTSLYPFLRFPNFARPSWIRISIVCAKYRQSMLPCKGDGYLAARCSRMPMLLRLHVLQALFAVNTGLTCKYELQCTLTPVVDLEVTHTWQTVLRAQRPTAVAVKYQESRANEQAFCEYSSRSYSLAVEVNGIGLELRSLAAAPS